MWLFAFVFCLFLFILVANLVGMFPYSFTVTSHLLMAVATTVIEILMCVVQAYIFAMFTCIYLQDALHSGH
ncbi:hypothetical protein CHELA20_51095 [Hyphomicrobiales bacterium]|nr:hypothetical protein CHELA20_51095 [Hyphomicrobiales bacterium]CAH1674093.1 hypothetical protein CHELA41_23915 [Hyphomicrobiales bacterium]